MINIQADNFHSAYDLIFKGDLMICTVIQVKKNQENLENYAKQNIKLLLIIDK